MVNQYSTWATVEIGLPKDSILALLLFLKYTNDLSDNLVSNPNQFADRTSLFSIACDNNFSGKNSNNDLKERKRKEKKEMNISMENEF